MEEGESVLISISGAGIMCSYDLLNLNLCAKNDYYMQKERCFYPFLKVFSWFSVRDMRCDETDVRRFSLFSGGNCSLIRSAGGHEGLSC